MADSKKQGKPITSLTISTKSKTPLSKNQQAFNKLTTRIEKLQKEVQKKERQFEDAMHLYSKVILPSEKELAVKSRELLMQSWPFLKDPKLAKSDRPHLKAMMKEHLQNVIDATAEEPDEELKQLFRELEGERYEQVKEREEAEMKAEMKEMFEQMGVELDDDFDPEDDAKMAEIRQQLQDRQEKEEQRRQQRLKNKKKTVKQLEREALQNAVNETKQKSISTVYRQLAKLFHPDLERNEERRVEKEALMKQLTEAYESKNLHALLLLELKWIHKESSHLESLTEDKLAVYLQILREQIQELEMEKMRIAQKPQYSILMQRFGFIVTQQPLRTINEEKLRQDELLRELSSDVENLKGNNPFGYLKQMIRQWKLEQQQQSKEDMMDELLSALMGGKGGRR